MEQLMAMLGGKPAMVDESSALPGRQEEMRVTDKHFVLGNSIKPPFPDNLETCVFATGCFWGTEKMFWRRPRRLLHLRGVRRRLHPEPHVRGDLQRSHRTH